MCVCVSVCVWVCVFVVCHSPVPREECVCVCVSEVSVVRIFVWHCLLFSCQLEHAMTRSNNREREREGEGRDK